MFWSKRIYADAAASTPLSRRAKRELVRVLDIYGNPGALHKEALAAKQELERARQTIAEAIGAHPDEIVFTASGTEANNLAIMGTLAPRLRMGEKLSAITSVIEHQSVLAPLNALEREGLEICVVDVQQDGLVFANAVPDAMQANTALVSIQLINSEVGAVQPVQEIAKALRRTQSPILLHTDASQAPLWYELKVEKLGVDMMTLDAQKIMGPKGIGCLYIKRGTLIDPVIWGGGQEKGRRAGTENAALAASFAAALKEAQSGAAKRRIKIAKVRDFLFAEIKKVLPDVVVHGPGIQEKGALRGASPSQTPFSSDSRAPNNLNISIPGLDGQMCVVAMDAAGIAISTRSACSTDDDEPSYVIAALGVDKKVAQEAVRITLLPDATLKDARRIAQVLSEIANRYKK